MRISRPRTTSAPENTTECDNPVMAWSGDKPDVHQSGVSVGVGSTLFAWTLPLPDTLTKFLLACGTAVFTSVISSYVQRYMRNRK